MLEFLPNIPDFPLFSPEFRHYFCLGGTLPHLLPAGYATDNALYFLREILLYDSAVKSSLRPLSESTADKTFFSVNVCNLMILPGKKKYVLETDCNLPFAQMYDGKEEKQTIDNKEKKQGNLITKFQLLNVRKYEAPDISTLLLDNRFFK